MSTDDSSQIGWRPIGVDQATATDIAYWGQHLPAQIDDDRTAALLAFWAERAAGVNANPPPRDAFAVEELRPWIGALSLWDHVGGEVGYVCRLYGSLVAQRLEHEMTNRPVADYPLGLGRAIRAQLDLVMELAQPVLIKVDQPRISHRVTERKVSRIEKLYLPLTRGGERLDCILSWYSYFETPRAGS